MQITKNQSKAAREVVDLIASEIGYNREVHSATAIATASRLSGSFLFKSFNLSLQDVVPGTAVLSNQANEEGPELINIISAILNSLGVAIDNNKMESASIEKAEVDFLESLEKTQEKAIVILKNNNLSNKEMAVACAVSTAFIIEQCKNDLLAETGFSTAIYGLIEGTKTVPPEIGKISSQKNKWYKFW